MTHEGSNGSRRSAALRRTFGRVVRRPTRVAEAADRTAAIEARVHAAAVDEGAHFNALAAHLSGLSRQVEQLLVASERSAARLESLARAVAELRTRSTASAVPAGVFVELAEMRAAVDDTRTAVTTVAELLGDMADPPSDRAAADHVPLVSVVIPVRDRVDEVVRAIESVRRQTHPRWECIVINDGSTDGTREAVEALAATDDRISVVRQAGRGEGAARNAGIERAQGELVAFLDSDNVMLSRHLQRAVAALELDRRHRWSVSTVAVDGGRGRRLLDPHRDVADLARENWVDTNMMVVDREALSSVGGFDPALERFADWDLALRLVAAVGPPATVGRVGVRYRADGVDRISTSRPGGPSDATVRTRHGLDRRADGLRVLVAEPHYPQHTETYMEADIVGLRAIGAHVEVFSDGDVAVDYPVEVPVHRGELADAIGAAAPHVVLTHWINIAHQHRPTTRALGIPHVVRTHGFEINDRTIADLLADPMVVVHAPTHIADAHGAHPRLVVESVAFDDRRYRPVPPSDKDRCLVVRTVAALRTKDIEVFVETARRCPDHRFVLVLGTVARRRALAEELEAALGSEGLVEVRRDLTHDQCAELVSAAGLYLHTHGTSHPFGQSISIVEAMATGAIPLVRDLPGADLVLAGAGVTYGGATVEERAEHAATIVRHTQRWSDDEWRRRWILAVDRAHAHHAAPRVAGRMVGEWCRIFGIDAAASVASR